MVAVRAGIVAAREEWTPQVAEPAWPRDLRSLRPRFGADAHGYYVDTLFAAISSSDPPRNVALGGTTAVGRAAFCWGCPDDCVCTV